MASLPGGPVPPYENAAHLVAHRLAYDEHVNAVVLQLEALTYAPTATTGPSQKPEVLTLLLDEARVSQLIEDLTLMRHWFHDQC